MVCTVGEKGNIMHLVFDRNYQLYPVLLKCPTGFLFYCKIAVILVNSLIKAQPSVLCTHAW